MSRPPLNPEKTAAGIAVDPRTLERVIPESKRPDGSVRKQIKIRPGFTPQEDVNLFRGRRQAQMEANVLPKGHIIGWVPPELSSSKSPGAPMSKSAKKNAKRKEKRQEKQEIKDNWEDDDAADETVAGPNATTRSTTAAVHSSDTPNWAAVAAKDARANEEEETAADADGLSTGFSKLDVR